MINVDKNLQELTLDELIQYINRFTALSRERELTPEETEQRRLLRAEYVQRFGRNLRATLDNTVFEYADGDGDGCNS